MALWQLDPTDPASWRATFVVLAGGIGQAFGGLDWSGWLLCGLALLVMVSLWQRAVNRLLPTRLRLRLPLLHWAETRLLGQLDQADLLQDLGHWLGERLRRLGDPELAARRRWLRHRLYGSRWRRPDLALVVLRGLDWLPTSTASGATAGSPSAPADWLRALIQVKGRRQGLLLITQTPGLSSLPSAFLDVWLPTDDPTAVAVPPVPITRALLLLDPASARIDTAAGPDRPTRLDEDAADAELHRIIGLPDPRNERDDFHRKRAALLDTGFSPADLLPALVLGSAPAGPLVIGCRMVDCPPPADWISDWALEVAPLVAALQASAGPEPDWGDLCDNLEEVFGFAERGDGILYSDWRETPARAWRRLIGRPGQRRRLAAALRALDPQADARLARLVAGGEVWQLRLALETLRGEARPGPREADAAARLPVRVELALWLLTERLALLRPAGSGEPAAATQPAVAEPGDQDACTPAAAPMGLSFDLPVATDADQVGGGWGLGGWGLGGCPVAGGLPKSDTDAIEPGAVPMTEATPEHPQDGAEAGPRDSLVSPSGATGANDPPTTASTASQGSSTASLLTTPPIAPRLWHALHQALNASTDPGLFTHAGRTCCAFLAVVATWDTAAAPIAADDGYPTGLAPLLAGLRAALDGSEPGPAPAPTASSPRARFHAEARELAETLSLVEPEIAAPLLEQRLRQDWSLLPAPFAALLREHCLHRGGERLLAALAKAADETALLAVAARWRLRPLAVVGALTWLALEHQRTPTQGARPDAPQIGLPIGRFIATMRARLPEHLELPPRLLPPPGLAPEQGRLASALLADPAFPNRLAPTLATGAAERETLRRRVDELGRVELDGIALGSRSPATRLIGEIAELALRGAVRTA